MYNSCMAKIFFALLLLVLTPVLAHANPGQGATNDFASGVFHPLFGLDHLLVMIAVGLWAAQLGRSALWMVPASFVGVMMIGGALGMAGISLPMVNAGVLASVFLLGLLITFAVRMPAWSGAGLVGLFALFHGHAHGSEMSATADGFLYGAGFILTTAALHLLGVGLGMSFKWVPYGPALRVAGALVLVGGVVAALG